MQATIQALFQRDFAAYARARRLPLHLHEAARSIMRCRTSALGGHVVGCSAGHIAGVWYNSCRHRACPQCSKLQIDRWLAGWRERLLPCAHYHVVFTLPHELLDLWKMNRKLFCDHMFRAARDTLFELLADDKYLGVQPGVIAALHTWGRTLTLHPHLHCLVTDGGLRPNGRWRSSAGGYLLPVRVVKALFRGKMMDLLRRSLDRGELSPPPERSDVQVSNLLRRAYSKKWNVRLQQRYAHGRGVVAYLGRYVRGGPIRDRRILQVTARAVTFSYRDHRDGVKKTMTLGAAEFIRRLLWHVPEPRSHVVRPYGLYARQAKPRCDAARAELPQQTNESSEPDRAQERVRLCEVCGRPIRCLQALSSARIFFVGLQVPSQFKYP